MKIYFCIKLFRNGCFYREEQLRLEEFSKLKYKIKILVNGGIVSETKERLFVHTYICLKCSLCNYLLISIHIRRLLEKPDFLVTYGEPFEIKMTHAPEIIALQVVYNIVVLVRMYILELKGYLHF